MAIWKCELMGFLSPWQAGLSLRTGDCACAGNNPGVPAEAEKGNAQEAILRQAFSPAAWSVSIPQDRLLWSKYNMDPFAYCVYPKR